MENIKFRPYFIFLISLLLLLVKLGKPDIYILDEAKNAECAREMLISGNYIVPKFNGQLRTDKPPLHYFFMALSYKLLGVSSFSARFFSVFFGACTVLISYLFSRRFLGETVGVLTAVVLLSSLHFNLQMRLAVPDPYLIFFITASVYCFFLFFETERLTWIILMYSCLGLGALTKGPVAMGLPAITFFIFLLLKRSFNWRIIHRFRLVPGFFIVGLIAFPWFLSNYVATHGEWTEGFFLKHNIERFTSTMEGHGGFFLLPEIMVIVGLMPFGVLAVRAYVDGVRSRNNGALLLSVIMITVIIVFFSFSRTKLPNYTAPAYPFAAILIAQVLAKLIKENRFYKAEMIVYSIIAFAIPIGIYVAFKLDPEYLRFANLAVYFLALPIGALIVWLGYAMKNSRLIVYTLSGSFLITNILFFAIAYPFVYRGNPVNASVVILRPAASIVYYKKLNPAYIFKLQRIIPGADSPELLRKYMEVHPRALIVSLLEFAQEIRSVVAVDTIFKGRDTFEKPATAIFKAKVRDDDVSVK